jgi:hypothetical protein
MLLLLIPLAWLGVVTFVVCLCRMAAMADSAEPPHGPRSAVRAQLLVIEPTRARPHRTRTATLAPRGFATLHSIR